MAAIRLDNVADNIESTLELALVDTKAASKALQDALASSSWEKVIYVMLCYSNISGYEIVKLSEIGSD